VKQTAYPIVFFGVRDGCLDIFEVPASQQTPAKINSLTLLLLSILTLTAVFVTDLGLINAVGGGLVATAIVFVFPTLMFYKVLQRMAGGLHKTTQWKELYGAAGMTVIGVVIGLIGAYIAVADGNGGGGKASA
jgi:sodium-coupled neutral amino acid transporter 11